MAKKGSALVRKDQAEQARAGRQPLSVLQHRRRSIGKRALLAQYCGM